MTATAQDMSPDHVVDHARPAATSSRPIGGSQGHPFRATMLVLEMLLAAGGGAGIGQLMTGAGAPDVGAPDIGVSAGAPSRLARLVVEPTAEGDTRSVMRALVVFESMWSKTEQVTHAVAAELGESIEVTTVDVTEAPADPRADLP